ncbi:MAG: hypothetical protein MZW92_49010 [Comamonadaceae bacterium]|nr:hypothetical protein [Comamonadaceae bacterium]
MLRWGGSSAPGAAAAGGGSAPASGGWSGRAATWCRSLASSGVFVHAGHPLHWRAARPCHEPDAPRSDRRTPGTRAWRRRRHGRAWSSTPMPPTRSTTSSRWPGRCCRRGTAAAGGDPRRAVQLRAPPRRASGARAARLAGRTAAACSAGMRAQLRR